MVEDEITTERHETVYACCVEPYPDVTFTIVDGECDIGIRFDAVCCVEPYPDVTFTIHNGEGDIGIRFNTAHCIEPYPDVTFTIHMRRGSLFYVINLIAPCFLIFLISFLGFFLPVESGDKVNLETTILLALVVFLLMVGETMPPTPDAIPILGTV